MDVLSRSPFDSPESCSAETGSRARAPGLEPDRATGPERLQNGHQLFHITFLPSVRWKGQGIVVVYGSGSQGSGLPDVIVQGWAGRKILMQSLSGGVAAGLGLRSSHPNGAARSRGRRPVRDGVSRRKRRCPHPLANSPGAMRENPAPC